jgi:outer membrane lipoprotein-sorting protein
MPLFDRHPRARWAVPTGAAALIIAGATLSPLAATAEGGLQPRTAEELLVALSEPTTTTVSGTVATVAELGLPALPMGMAPEGGPLALASGEQTLRVWSDGPTRQRVALLERSAERTLVRNGTEVWVWSSSEATADRYELPAKPAGDPERELPPGTTLPSTPQEAATLALEALDPTTEVSTSGLARIAGRDAYELVLQPRDGQTLVERVAIAIDGETNVPLRVRVYSTKQADPALEVGFTSVDYTTPDPALFTFVPPAGAEITEHPALTQEDLEGLAHPAGPRPGTAEPTLVGEGWSAVLVGDLPADALADLAESGSRAEDESGSDDPAAAALALLQAMPETSGDWGTGRVLAGTLFSAIVTDDDRFAIGAVPPEVLGAALAAR